MSLQDPKQALLNAAEPLFLAKGFEGVSVRDITLAAGVNVAAINYYFSGKKNLYREVLRRRFIEAAQRKTKVLEQIMAEDPPPDLRRVLEVYVLDFFDSILGSEENERLLQLAYKEMSPDSIAADIVLETLVNPIHLSLRAAILQARPGLQGITAGRCVSSITGQVLHFIRAREILCGLAGENYNDVFIQDSINHIVDFSLKGIGEQP